MTQPREASINTHWREAFSRVEFTLPSPEFEAKLVGACDGARPVASLGSSTTLAIRAALQSMLANSDIKQAQRLFQALADNEAALIDLALDPTQELASLPIDTLLHLACAKTAITAQAPDRVLLGKLARTFVDRWPKKKSQHPHAIFLLGLQTAAYAAWLAQDLLLLRRAVALRGAVAIFPLQWKLMQQVAAKAASVKHKGKTYLRVDDTETSAALDRLLQLHCFPFFDQAEAAVLGERCFGGSLIGGYTFAWIYLQSFAESPAVQSDWATLQRLMVGGRQS